MEQLLLMRQVYLCDLQMRVLSLKLYQVVNSCFQIYLSYC